MYEITIKLHFMNQAVNQLPYMNGIVQKQLFLKQAAVHLLLTLDDLVVDISRYLGPRCDS